MIGIVDYGAGNVASVMYALEALREQAVLTNNPVELQKCDGIIFPGVGEASSAMEKICDAELDTFLQQSQKPLLGICLGMQLLTAFSEEGNTKCLDIVPGTCKMFDKTQVRVPHIGWETVHYESDCELFSGIIQDSFFYFAHSFYVPISPVTSAQANNDCSFTAALQYKNIYGVQFHPEKSGEAGLQLLRNFVSLTAKEPS